MKRVIRALDFASAVKRKFTFVPPKPNFAIMPQIIAALQSRRAFGLTRVPRQMLRSLLQLHSLGRRSGAQKYFSRASIKRNDVLADCPHISA
jgi:hypothetical protein